jgi:hypothetical protein
LILRQRTAAAGCRRGADNARAPPPGCAIKQNKSSHALEGDWDRFFAKILLKQIKAKGALSHRNTNHTTAQITRKYEQSSF